MSTQAEQLRRQIIGRDRATAEQRSKLVFASIDGKKPYTKEELSGGLDAYAEKLAKIAHKILKLTPSQLEAIQMAKARGGALVRWNGGFWSHEAPGHPKAWPKGMWSTGWKTIEALIKKNILVSCEERSNRAGTFSVKVKLTELGEAL